MNRMISMIIMFVVFTGILSLGHYYIWRKLVKNTGVQGKIKKIITIAIIALGISFPFSYLMARVVSYDVSFYFLWISTLWLGMLLLFFFSFFFMDLGRFLVFSFKKVTKSEAVESPERRAFIAKSVAIGASSAVFGGTVWGLKTYYEPAKVKTVPIKIKRLPQSFKGFTIAQITDIHIGQIMRRDTLAAIVETVNRIKPDVIAITGDLADGSVGKLFKEIEPLKDLKAKHGVFFITGNHEYYSGADEWKKAVASLGITVLDNKHKKITNEKGEAFYLVGVNDREGSRFGKEHAPDFKKAFSGIQQDMCKILLAHQPLDVKEASDYHTDLVLSGHTHGGQIWPFGYFVQAQQKYLKGYFKYKNTQLYVNQGTGCWGPPMRVGTENEITKIVLS